MAQPKKVISIRTEVHGQPFITERLSSAIITPGMLVEESSGTVAPHSTAAVNAQKLFAQTNLPVAGSIDTDYAVGETVRYGAYGSGAEVNALVAAGAAAIVDGDALESAGDGTLRKVVTDAATDDTQRDSIVAYAIIDVDNSGGATTARIDARVA